MLSQKEQGLVLSLVKQTRSLIYRELEAAKITVKGAADYVTNVDFAVQEFMKAELEKEFPGIRMIAEEKENRNLSEEESYWILDPIDGTTNLIHHFGMSAVSLALYEAGEITFGAVYNPFHEELFYAVKGQGAFLNEEQIHVSDMTDFQDAVVSFGSCPYDKERGKKCFPLFCELYVNSADFRRTGSAALDLCYVACGRQHAYLEQNLKPWDYAAGSLILEEAGGVVQDWNGYPLPYLRNADVTGVTKNLEREFMNYIKKAGD